jgi:hypothetical protein
MTTDPTPDSPAEPSPIVHLYVLLDRSGSMAAMADDVIGGFNRLLADQQADGDDARMTLVQFDTENAQEVLADAVPLAEMMPLDAATFVPRGGTPLLDATGVLLGTAVQRAHVLASVGAPAEEVVVVSITDGHENASREFSLDAVRKLVAERQAAGWTFVFLGAGLDVYGEAGGLGYDTRSVQSFAASPDGAGVAFDSLSQSTRTMRSKVRSGRQFDKGDFFEDGKPAEEHRRRRGH